jgi:hypothetical protein
MLTARMGPRRLLNIVTAVSLMVAMVSASAWARAWWSWRYEGLYYTWGGDEYRLLNGPFNLALNRTTPLARATLAPPPDGWQRFSLASNESDFDAAAEYIRANGGRARAGFIVMRNRFATGVAAPHWFIVGCAALLPIARGASWWQRRRQVAVGHCASCGTTSARRLSVARSAANRQCTPPAKLAVGLKRASSTSRRRCRCCCAGSRRPSHREPPPSVAPSAGR